VPLTLGRHEKKLHDPALCEQLPVRDYLDNVVVRTNGSFVARYELKGLTSYFASDAGRDRGKLMIEALLRALPEQSMKVQIRYEIVEDLGQDPSSVQGRQSILQPDSKLPDTCVLQFFRVLILGQAFVAHATAEVSDVPVARAI